MSLRTFLTNLRSALPDSVPNKPPITFTRGANMGAGTLRSAALWPDGSRVAIATTRGVAVYLLDRAARRWIRQWSGSTAGWAVSVSVAAARVATGTHDGRVTIWSADTGAEICTWQQGGLCHVALNREGSRVAVAGKSGVALCNATTGERERDLEGTSQEVTAVAFDGQASRVAAVDYSGQALIWDADTGRELRRWKSPGPLRAVAFSSDGARLAAAGKVLTIWDIDMDLQVHTASAPGPMLSVAFAAGREQKGGDRLVTGTARNRALVWDLATGEYGAVALHIDDVHSAGFMPGQGDEIWVASQKLDVYALDRGQAGEDGPVLAMPIFARALHIRSSADRIAIADKQVITLWDHAGESGAVLDGHTHTIKNLWFRDRGAQLLSHSPRELISWDATTGARRWTLNAENSATAADAVAGAGLSRDGARLAVALERAGRFHLVLCDPDSGAETREIAAIERRGMAISELALGPDAAALAVRASSRVTVWDVAQGSVRFTVEQVANRDGVMQWSPDGALLALGLSKGDVVLYDARTGRKHHTVADGAAGAATALIFSHDGSLLAGSFKGRPADQIYVWNASTGKRVYGPLNGGRGARICQSLAIRPDSSTLVAGFSDSQDSGTWVAWHLATGETIEVHAGEALKPGSGDPIWATAFTANGSILVTATGDGTATLWTI